MEASAKEGLYLRVVLDEGNTNMICLADRVSQTPSVVVQRGWCRCNSILPRSGVTFLGQCMLKANISPYFGVEKWYLSWWPNFMLYISVDRKILHGTSIHSGLSTNPPKLRCPRLKRICPPVQTNKETARDASKQLAISLHGAEGKK